MSFLWITLLLSFFSFFPAASILPTYAHEHRGALPDTWYHPQDHPVHALFRRDILTDGHDYPSVGSQGLFLIRHPPRVLADLLHLEAWINTYPNPPAGPVDPGAMPKFWSDFIKTAINENKIPNIPKATLDDHGNPKYPSNIDPNSAAVCLAFVTDCKIPGDIWDAPDGKVAIGFDDGPALVSGSFFVFANTFCVSPAVVL